MLRNYGPIWQALLGTTFTWGLTAVGAGVVVFIDGRKRKLLDVSLGFAAGVMIAASYWSLLSPAIEMTSQSDIYGDFAFIPVAIGFFLGCLFVYMVDVFLSDYNLSTSLHAGENNYGGLPVSGSYNKDLYNTNRRRRRIANEPFLSKKTHSLESLVQWKRILMLIIAITVHNIPEGLAVGVSFGAIGSSPSATFSNARNLAIGIGIQNFPEGLAVSLPLKAAGYSNWKSFWYGQLSGMVEPIAGLMGAFLVVLATPVLPYALSFAAGAMIYVVVDDIIPEANSSENGKLASWGCVVGFLIMMVLDVGLG
ncbi:hypothetical protein V9T40_009863 [Parthenolecanium corni]|uniref:Zinc transporter ZIP11 n=1 Tax=Parthenolecanium corni TaxID=536013 RepID=A0AAN9Y7T7_9HEMI